MTRRDLYAKLRRFHSLALIISWEQPPPEDDEGLWTILTAGGDTVRLTTGQLGPWLDGYAQGTHTIETKENAR